MVSTVFAKGALGILLRIRSIIFCTVNVSLGCQKPFAIPPAGSMIKAVPYAVFANVLTNSLLFQRLSAGVSIDFLIIKYFAGKEIFLNNFQASGKKIETEQFKSIMLIPTANN